MTVLRWVRVAQPHLGSQNCFAGVERFGISAITPADLLRRIDTAP
jgi:hypothetical protein